MPINFGKDKQGNFVRWGNQKKYYFHDKQSKYKALRKAERQMSAIIYSEKKKPGIFRRGKLGGNDAGIQPAYTDKNIGYDRNGNKARIEDYSVGNKKYGKLSGLFHSLGFHTARDVAHAVGLGVEGSHRNDRVMGEFQQNVGNATNLNMVAKHKLLNATAVPN